MPSSLTFNSEITSLKYLAARLTDCTNQVRGSRSKALSPTNLKLDETSIYVANGSSL